MLADELEADDPARAELIRVQCELARTAGVPNDFCLSCYGGGGVPDTSVRPPRKTECWHCHRRNRERERDLLDANADRWRRGPACEACGGEKGYWDDGGFKYQKPLWLPCPACWGSGDACCLVGHVEHEPHDGHKVKVGYVRGMKRVHCLLGEVCEPRPHGFDMRGPDCGVDWAGRNGFACRCPWARSRHGDRCPEHGKTGVPVPEWLPTAWASAVCRHHPDVTEFWVALPFDMEPGRYEWRHPNEFLARSGIPTFLFDLIHGHDSSTADAAHTAMARALACWVHDSLKENAQ